jgi:hypothetical protein
MGGEGGARHPIGQNHRRTPGKVIQRKRGTKIPKDKGANEQIRNRIGESKRCGSHSKRGRIQ